MSTPGAGLRQAGHFGRIDTVFGIAALIVIASGLNLGSIARSKPEDQSARISVRRG